MCCRIEQLLAVHRVAAGTRHAEIEREQAFSKHCQFRLADHLAHSFHCLAISSDTRKYEGKGLPGQAAM